MRLRGHQQTDSAHPADDRRIVVAVQSAVEILGESAADDQDHADDKTDEQAAGGVGGGLAEQLVVALEVEQRAVQIGGRKAGGWVYRNVDQRVVDGVVNGAGLGTRRLARGLRYVQSGQAQWYAAALFLGVVGLAVVVTQLVGR